MKESIVIEKLNGHDKEGKIGKILKKPGDQVLVGDLMFTIESGKGAINVKSSWEGTILELKINEGETVKKGQTVGSVDSTGTGSGQGSAASTGKQAGGQPASKGYSFGLAKPESVTLDVDVLIIGGGPGGYVAAIRGAQEGLRVALIEEDRLGGTCLNYGCIPTKAMANSVSVLNNIKLSENHGISVGEVRLDFGKLMSRKEDVVNQLVDGIEHLMEAHGIEYINGRAFVDEQGGIRVHTKRTHYQFKYKNLILALGSKPASLPIPGSQLPDILTSEDLLSMNEIPKSITIIGGGVIGMEFAFIYRALGAEVNVVEFLPQILNILDEDVAEVIKTSAEEKGIKIFENAKALGIQNTLDGSKLLEVEINGEPTSICSQKVAMAVGRRANLESMDLEKLGVQLNERNNGIVVNNFMQTNVAQIYAIGDVTNKIQLAHVASHQGMVAIDHILGHSHEMDYQFVPSAIFTNPEIGNVGMSEKEAQKQGLEILVGKFPFVANGKALTMDEPEGFVKIIADGHSKIILGGAVVGIHATDLMSVLTNLIVSKTHMDEAAKVIYAHPTTSESIHEAILMLDNRGIHFA